MAARTRIFFFFLYQHTAPPSRVPLESSPYIVSVHEGRSKLENSRCSLAREIWSFPRNYIEVVSFVDERRRARREIVDVAAAMSIFSLPFTDGVGTRLFFR